MRLRVRRGSAFGAELSSRPVHAVRFPPPLQRGARIGITAPSSGVSPRCHARLDRVLSRARALGYEPTEGRCLLASGLESAFEQRSSLLHQGRWADFAQGPDLTFTFTEPTRWRELRTPAAPQGRFEGRLIGGCLDVMKALVGTPFGDVPAFVDG